MRRLEKDESLCIGCHQCEEACSKAFYKVSDPMKSCIRITDKEDGSHHIAVCTQCGKCSEVCNTGVITEDARGVYRLNKKECAGCLMCVGFVRIVRKSMSDRSDPSGRRVKGGERHD